MDMDEDKDVVEEGVIVQVVTIVIIQGRRDGRSFECSQRWRGLDHS